MDSDVHKEIKEEKENTTNLQGDSVNKSESSLKNDNVSENISDVEKEEKMNREKDSHMEDEPCSGAKEEPFWEEKYATLNDSHLRLIAEFDNFRKRTIREKADLIKSGGASVLTNLLPVIDDFERALSTLQTTEDLSSAVEGVKLIYDKFIGYLSQQGVKVIDAVGQPFDTEFFEAVATIPASEGDKKGKVIDCVQTGYMLYDKVLRHAKVVVGE
ncbi:MAG: nucleotide exchange factor GrpE [Tannerella sp.]|nr:nucleotide exchange factor GrpE [Tannerella sp.]